MIGTLLARVILPYVVFHDGNPRRLTAEGAFSVENLAVRAAGMVAGAAVRSESAFSLHTEMTEMISELEQGSHAKEGAEPPAMGSS